MPQTSEAITADLAKAGIRAQKRFVGEIGPYVNQVRDGKAEPMFEWSWGYYSVFDADAILYDVMKCGEPYSYYCNKELDDLIIQGRSTLDQKRRTQIYAKAQRLIFDDAAYLYKWGLRGVWGISNRVDYAGASRRDRPHVPGHPAQEVGPARAPHGDGTVARATGRLGGAPRPLHLDSQETAPLVGRHANGEAWRGRPAPSISTVQETAPIVGRRANGEARRGRRAPSD